MYKKGKIMNNSSVFVVPKAPRNFFLPLSTRYNEIFKNRVSPPPPPPQFFILGGGACPPYISILGGASPPNLDSLNPSLVIGVVGGSSGWGFAGGSSGRMSIHLLFSLQLLHPFLILQTDFLSLVKDWPDQVSAGARYNLARHSQLYDLWKYVMIQHLQVKKFLPQTFWYFYFEICF